MAFFAVCILTMRNSSCVLLSLSLCSHGASFTVLRPRAAVRQWQGRGCCEERQEYAQTHLTWQVGPVLASAWNAQYPTPRCQSQPCPNCIWPFHTFGFASVFEVLDVRKRLTHRRQTKQCYDRRGRPISTLHANQPAYFQHPPRKGCTRGTIGPRSYIVKSIDGITYKHSRVHIRPFTFRDPSHSEPQHYNTSMPVPLFLILMLPVTRMLYQWIRNPNQCLQILETLHVAITPDFSAIEDHPSGCAITLPKADGAHLSALYRFPFFT